MARQFSPRELEIFSELNSMGYSQKGIADLAGVSQATISRVLRSEKTKKEKEVHKNGKTVKQRTG